MRNKVLVAFLLATFLGSCEYINSKRVRGNGDHQSETRNEKGFQSVELSGSFHLYARQDSAYSVRVEADANLLNYIETYVYKNTLIIRNKRGVRLNPTSSVKVYISSPGYRFFDISGASELNTEGRLNASDELFVDLSGASSANMDIRSPKTEFDITGASRATIRGETKDLTIDGSGASKFHGYDLLSENTSVDISGACGAEVYSSVKLKASASGASHIYYKGNATVDQETSGASSIKKAE